MAGMVRFSEADLKRLKAAYKSAVDAGEKQFTFDGHDLLVSYAKYMIEYLEQQFARGK